MHIIIDMGGTNTRIGFSIDREKFDNIVRFPTPQSQEESYKLFTEHLAGKQISSIIFGIAGVVNYKVNRIVNVTNIPWINDMSAEEITGISGHNIKSYNDAELAGLAEAHQPYANMYEDVAYITISTGVGGTIIRGKKPATINYNFEPGHMVLDKSSYIDNPASGIHGSFENLCSGTAFRKLYKIDPQECTDREIWKQYGENLADGLHNISLLWQPKAIVLGGGMTRQWEMFYDAVVQRITSFPTYYEQPVILRSELDDTNGLLGGLKVLPASYKAL